MEFTLSKAQEEYFRRFIKEHPIPENYDPDDLDDRRNSESEYQALAFIMKRLLEQHSGNK